MACPQARGSVLKADEKARSHHPLISVVDLGRMRVLVVEDEVKMAALLRRGLGEEGLTVDVAGEGERAVEMAGASKYDAVVLDVMLPGIDGFETCRRPRRDGVWAPARTTWSSRSPSPSCWRGCGRWSGAATSSAPPHSRSARCGSTPAPTRS